MKMKNIVLIITFLTIVCGTNSIAIADKGNDIISEEIVEINAEDIGIKTTTIEDDFKDDEINNEFVENETIESDDYFELEINNEFVTESPITHEDKVVGYMEDIYFEPNENDCDIDEECYDCEDDSHVYVHCVFMEDDKYIYEEWCEICGHGTEKLITYEEFDVLGVEPDVEF